MLSKIWAALRWKCPHCHQGDMFKTSPLEGIYNMHKECPKCHQPFELEPGFYWGAMYMGYGLSSAYMLGGFVICIFLLGLSVGQSFFLLIGLGIFIVPWIARTARSLWLTLYVAYDKDAIAKYTKKHDGHSH